MRCTSSTTKYLTTKMFQRFFSYLLLIITILIFMTTIPANGLANCPLVCECDDETLVVNCGEGHLDVLPIALNPSIQRLVIKHNKIKTIDSSIQFYAELTFLDLSYNYLFSIPQRTFLYQKKLQELHLNHNKIGSINNRTFVGLNSLVVLNLRGNFIDELESGLFISLPKLEELNLGQNRISKIGPDAFSGLNNLRVLYLDDNTLTTVPSATFNAVPALAELYLGVNSYKTLPAKGFIKLNGLSKLDLKGAGLHNISNESLKGLESLRILDISDNLLQRIPTTELSTLKRLEELSLGQNNFEIIPQGAFTGLYNLRKLYITGASNLKKIECSAFATNTNLELLSLTSNEKLSEIQEGALSGLPHLRYVILKQNAITTLAEGLIPWSDLHVLDLSDNPINCDCHVLWLRNLLISKNYSSDTITDILCDSPAKLKQKSLKSLSPEELGCSNIDTKKQAIIGALLVVSVATITVLVLIVYRCRKRIQEVLKGGWGNSSLGCKEREYQKTFTDEEYMSRHPHPHSHPCNLGIHSTLNNYPYHHSELRPVPVTEL